MKIPYSKQKTGNSCGAAVIEMIAKHHGIEITQDELIKRLNVEKIGYTKKSKLRKVLDELGLSHKEYAQKVDHQSGNQLIKDGQLEIVKGNNLEHLLKDLDSGNPAIINYAPGGQGHYVVAHSHDNAHIIVHDPALGADQRIPLKNFETKWVSGNKKWKKWYITISKKS
jgi:ABC-type bacteriocin/lantibiotic exporter with double-glycine peptidase domain